MMFLYSYSCEPKKYYEKRILIGRRDLSIKHPFSSFGEYLHSLGIGKDVVSTIIQRKEFRAQNECWPFTVYVNESDLLEIDKSMWRRCSKICKSWLSINLPHSLDKTIYQDILAPKIGTLRKPERALPITLFPLFCRSMRYSDKNRRTTVKGKSIIIETKPEEIIEEITTLLSRNMDKRAQVYVSCFQTCVTEVPDEEQIVEEAEITIYEASDPLELEKMIKKNLPATNGFDIFMREGIEGVKKFMNKTRKRKAGEIEEIIQHYEK